MSIDFKNYLYAIDSKCSRLRHTQGLTYKVLISRCLILFCFIFSTPTFAKTSSSVEPDSPSIKIPSRLVTLNPALTELIFEMGFGEHLVGVSEHSDWPPAALKIKRVGSYTQPNLEKIIEMKPDLVLTSKEGVDTYSSRLKKSGVRSEILELASLSDYPKVIRKLGGLLNQTARGQELIQKWEQTWNQVDQLAQKTKPTDLNIQKRFVIEVDQNPSYFAGRKTFLSETLERCGFENAFKKTGYFRGQPETLRNLDFVVIVQIDAMGSQKSSVVSQWFKYPWTKTKIITHVPANEVTRLTSRLPIAIFDLCKKIGDSKS